METEQEREREGSPDERRECGLPGGGQGRRDETGHSGVYPVSSMGGASGEARVEGEQSWGQGARGAAGYEDSGDSEIMVSDGVDIPGLSGGREQDAGDDKVSPAAPQSTDRTAPATDPPSGQG
jgi:hypothetical protein